MIMNVVSLSPIIRNIIVCYLSSSSPSIHHQAKRDKSDQRLCKSTALTATGVVQMLPYWITSSNVDLQKKMYTFHA